MSFILLALLLCSVSAQKVPPTTQNAVDIQETTTDAVTEPIPGPDEIATASIDSTSKSTETTSNEIVTTESPTEAVSDTPVVVKTSSKAPVNIRSSSEAPVDAQSSSEAPVDVQSSSEAPKNVRSSSEAPVDVQSSSEAPVDVQSSSEAPVDVQSSSEAPVDVQSSSEAPVDVQSSSESIATKKGPTPVAPPCPKSLCIGKSNGNYEIVGYPHDFVQCSNGIATCQSCWPQSLFFSQTCNQCLYKKKDSCYTTKIWKPQSTYPCPDACPNKGPNFSGNIADNISNGGAGNPYQYIGCWKGVTQGCVICPAGLKFNEQSNACLFDGLYQTKPK